MSVLFDALWWWRAEFGGKSNPYVESETERPRVLPSAGTTESATTLAQRELDVQPSMVSMNEPMLPNLFLDASELPDWNWEELGDLDFNWC
jgi:hypothetical protein